VLAPLFVWLELLFVGGYRRELQAQLKSRIEANIAAHREQRRTSAKAALLDDASEAAANSESQES